SSASSSPTPVPVSGLTSVTAISTGYDSSCALRADGTVWCWGGNIYGSLGLGAGRVDSDSHPMATRVSVVENVTSLSVGFASVCAIEADRSVWYWGENESDELGHDNVTDSPCAGGSKCGPLPTKVVGISADQISVGAHTTCVINSGDGFCWGLGANGQFGDAKPPSTAMTPTPTAVSIPPNITKISVDPWPGFSVANACAIDAAKNLWCWGSNQFGQLAHTPGTLGDVSCPSGTFCNSTPARITAEADGGGGFLDVVDVQAGFATCAVLSDGTVRCWGINQNSELGQGTVGGMTSTPTPVAAIGSDGLYVTGTDSKCVTGKSGKVWCWGDAFLGVPGSFGVDAGCASYGSNAPVPCVLMPQPIPNLLAKRASSVDLNNAAALTVDGSVVAWGRNSYGADGHLDFTNGDQTSGGLPANPIPMRVPGFP
ncbi:MAG: hypothetical protein ABI183_02140, partial [Polyangiaceae bacterium]